MLILAIVALLTGAVLGLRFKVLVLLPVIGLLILGVPIVGLAYSLSVPSIALTLGLSIAWLQLGYLGGVGTRYAMVMSRAARLRARCSRRAVPRPAV
jgi:hypothetical protein